MKDTPHPKKKVLGFRPDKVITGDSWSEAVARPLVHGQDGVLAFGSARLGMEPKAKKIPTALYMF